MSQYSLHPNSSKRILHEQYVFKEQLLTPLLVVPNYANTKVYKKTWHIGAHLMVLSKSYPMKTNMTGIRWFVKNLCVLALWAKVSSALEIKLKKNNYVQSNMFQSNALICKNAHMCQTWAYFRFKWIDGMACGIDCWKHLYLPVLKNYRKKMAKHGMVTIFAL